MFTPPQDKINQGLDIQGGLSVVLSAKSTDGDAVTSEDMEKSRAIIEQRVNALGASEAVVQLQGSDQILVQIPGLSDTETALSTIGKTGKLEFARLDSFTDEDVKTKIENGQYGANSTITDDFGNKLPSGKTEHLTVEEGTYTPLITGSNITKVDIGRASETGTDYSVNISLDSEGTKRSPTPRRTWQAPRARSSSSLTAKCSPRRPCSPRSPAARSPSPAATTRKPPPPWRRCSSPARCP